MQHSNALSKDKFIVRELSTGDLLALQSIHKKMAPDYELPNLFSTLVPVKSCAITLGGDIITAGAVRIIGEGYLWVNRDFRSGTKEETLDVKLAAIRMLEHDITREAKRIGLEQLSVWIPPHLQDKTEPLLKLYDFVKSPWQSYTKNL